MELIVNGAKTVISDELIESLVEISITIYEATKEIAENVSTALQTILEQSHQHCYSEENVKHFYDKNKGCHCKRVTYKCSCGRKYYETYECYEPPPKQSDKSRVLKRNKRKCR